MQGVMWALTRDGMEQNTVLNQQQLSKEKRCVHSVLLALETHVCILAQNKVSSVRETRSSLYFAFSLCENT